MEVQLGYQYQKPVFYPYAKRVLIIRNLSKRDTAIMSIDEYRPGESYVNIINDDVMEIPGWKLKK